MLKKKRRYVQLNTYGKKYNLKQRNRSSSGGLSGRRAVWVSVFNNFFQWENYDQNRRNIARSRSESK